jgi:hypothetical protein
VTAPDPSEPAAPGLAGPEFAGLEFVGVEPQGYCDPATGVCQPVPATGRSPEPQPSEPEVPPVAAP